MGEHSARVVGDVEVLGTVPTGQLPLARGTAPPLPAAEVLHLAELVDVVRRELAIDSAFPDAAILASLQTIARRSDPRERWRAAFESNLGHWLALKGSDLNTALGVLVALMPRPTS